MRFSHMSNLIISILAHSWWATQPVETLLLSLPGFPDNSTHALCSNFQDILYNHKLSPLEYSWLLPGPQAEQAQLLYHNPPQTTWITEHLWSLLKSYLRTTAIMTSCSTSIQITLITEHLWSFHMSQFRTTMTTPPCSFSIQTRWQLLKQNPMISQLHVPSL